MIDDFEDCTTTEKEFMKLWNGFVLNQTVTADAQVSRVVIQFTQTNGTRIIEEGLEHFFSMHLLHLYGTSLISTADLTRCTDILAKKKKS
jgi:hypothetical protein